MNYLGAIDKTKPITIIPKRKKVYIKCYLTNQKEQKTIVIDKDKFSMVLHFDTYSEEKLKLR